MIQQQQQKIQQLSVDVLNETYTYIFGPEKFDILRQALIDSEAVIAGGGVLAAYAGYGVSDLDIYVNVESAEELYLTMRKSMGYHIAEKWGNVAPAYDESFFRKNNILARFRLYHEDHLPSIDIMMIPDHIPVRQVVTNFDLSFCQVWYDGQTVETNHRRDILSKHGFLQKDYQESLFQKFNWFIISRIRKYNDRGFKVQVSMTPMLKKFMTKIQGAQLTQQNQASRKPIFVNVLMTQYDQILIHQIDDYINIDICISEDYGPYTLNYVSHFPLAMDERYSTVQSIRQISDVTSPEEWVAKKIYKRLIRIHHDEDEDYDRTVFWIMRHPLYPANMATINEYLEEFYPNELDRNSFLLTVFYDLQYYNQREKYLQFMTEYTGINYDDLPFFDHQFSDHQLRLPTNIDWAPPLELPFLGEHDDYLGQQNLSQRQEQEQILNRFLKGQVSRQDLQHLPVEKLFRIVRNFNPRMMQILLDQMDKQKRKRQALPKERQITLIRNFLRGQSGVSQSGQVPKFDLEAVRRPTMLEIVRQFNPSVSQQATKQQLFALLQAERKRRIQQLKAAVVAPSSEQQQIIDSFTREYLTDPVLASDGTIYNRSTVQSMLAATGRTRTGTGVVQNFQTIQQLQRTNPAKAQQLKQIKRKALQKQQLG